jgi:glucose/arabinose dehydrogenase
VTGLNNPVFVTHAPGDTDRLFVLEQEGRIRLIRNGTLNAAPFLDIADRVELLTWEQGLLGLAFHPLYAQNGLFYVHYDGNGDGSAVISEFRVSSDADVADPASERVLLTVATVDGYHNGGSINFGPDSLLYIGLGDGGGLGAAAGPSRLNAQDVTTLRGGMSRISPQALGAQPYSVPPGNLIDVNPQARPELWSKGLRNPYRSNFDPCTGALYIGDVGDRSWEEVNVEPPATGHRNYGWPILEGDECFGGAAAAGCDRTGLTPPVHAHPSANTGGPQFQAVIGGSVYRGSAIPALRGTYFFTDLYGNTRTFRYDVPSDSITEVVSLESDLNPAENDQGLVAIQSGGDGELYFVSRGSSGGGGDFAPQDPIGTIYRLEAEWAAEW